MSISSAMTSAPAAPHLLHLNCSMDITNSISRRLALAFSTEWQHHHPNGSVVYRDLTRPPIPHITSDIRAWMLSQAYYPKAEAPECPEELKALAIELHTEFNMASTVIIGAPMYNYSFPSSFKAWLDWIILPTHLVEIVGLEVAPHRFKRIVVASARGSGYQAGSGHSRFVRYQEEYLEDLFGALGITDFSLISAELTAAAHVPQMAHLVPVAEKSLEEATLALQELARN